MERSFSNRILVTQAHYTQTTILMDGWDGILPTFVENTMLVYVYVWILL